MIFISRFGDYLLNGVAIITIGVFFFILYKIFYYLHTPDMGSGGIPD